MAGVHFVGVPAPHVAPPVRRTIEQAWFDRQALRLRYRGADEILTTRVVRIVSAVMDRGGTLLNCDDLEKGQRRQFRLDRILEAELV
jgi:predicted DNA-binding transcriptional regulator YafY